MAADAKLTSRSSSPATETSSVIMMDTVNGSHNLKIAGYSLTKGIGIGQCITSSVFTIGGRNWSIKYYPDGYDSSCNDCISLFLVLVSDVPDVKALYRMNLVDRHGALLSVYTFSETSTFKYCHVSWGYRRFVRRADLETSDYFDDCFTVRCDIRVINTPRAEVTKTRSVMVPPSNLHQHLGQLLKTGEGADVVFEVNGETFAAHRWMLAARSPVFRAELFGAMKEESMRRIKIEDMETSVFRAVLHFIYTDSLPEMEELICTGTTTASAAMAQHLLVAADRYGMERLKSLCEDKLCKGIDVGTVATTLALAEQHHCEVLKTACLEFVVSPENLKPVMEGDGFEHLSTSCSSVLKELIGKLGGL